jgi:hypothetical protein
VEYRGLERRATVCDLPQNCPLEEKVNKMFADLYVGSDKENPSMTSRLLLVEDAVARFSKNSNKAIWLLVSLLAAAAINIGLHFVGK